MSTVTTLRPFVPDCTICDWFELQETYGLAPFDSNALQADWHISQPQASRRLQTMERHGLITCIKHGGGRGGKSIYVVKGA